MATDCSTEGMPVYPKAAPPSRVVRGGGAPRFVSAVKGAFHDLVSSSCTSGRMAPEGGGALSARPPPRNHSSSLEESGCGGGLHKSPTFSAARESIAVISGSGSDNATTPKGAMQPYSDRESSPSNAVIDIRSSGGALKETGGVPHSVEVPARSNGTPTGCRVFERWETLLGEALIVIFKSPERQIAAEENVWHRGVYYATPRWSCLHKKNMNHPRKFPQRAECPGTRQQSWPSWAPDNDHIQKRTGDKTSLKRRDHPCCSFSAEERRGAGHRTLLVWLSAER